MKVLKKIQGNEVLLELEKIKDYGRYSLYQVYLIKNGKRIPQYKECYTELQIKDIIKNEYKLEEEVFN